MQCSQARAPGTPPLTTITSPTASPADGADCSLIEALATDLPSAFECLVREYQRRFYVLAYRMLNSAPDAEEVTQDTFMRAYRALAGYPPERIRALRLDAWLYRILLNLTRNRVRSGGIRTLSLDIPEAEQPAPVRADPASQPEVALMRSEDARTLATALARLPFHLRAAVILRHVQGYPYRDIAALLDQPEGTVKAHVSRGSRLLRTMVAGDVAPRPTTSLKGGRP